MKKYILIFLTIFMSGSSIRIEADYERMIFIGDSFTAGAVATNWNGYADITGKELNYSVTKFVTYTFPETEIIWPLIIQSSPDVIVLELGIHIISGRDLTQTDEQIAIAVDRLIEKSLLLTEEVYYLLIPWRGWGIENNVRALHINSIIRMECQKYGVQVVDTWDAMELCGWNCIGWDNSHPNDLGHQIIAQEVIKTVDGRYNYYFPVILN